ncbi:hypothetical protein ABT255_42410 [Streptomyces mirabilis]|uniref:hypothetical protein n=1 Tax=Streptomyces mirabilis TaxID=68239 RepID=UPI00332BA41F
MSDVNVTQLVETVSELSRVAVSRGVDAATAAQLDTLLTPNLLRGEAVNLYQQAATLLDQADELELKAKLREAVLQLDAPFEAALQEEKRFVSAVETAIQDERTAEDEARNAAENHHLAVEAEREGQACKLSAAEQTTLLLTVRAAADVAARLQAAAEVAKAHRESLEQQLTAARQAVRERKAACEAASTLAQNPPAVPVSAVTALLDGFRRLTWGLPLDKQAMSVVAGVVEAAASKTGVTNWLQASAVEQHDRERASVAFERNMPAKGHPFRPSNPASPVFAVRPPTG